MAWAVWITGLPGSGKTTIALETKKRLEERGIKTTVLELDEIRKVLTPEPKYTEDERSVVYAALAYMAKLLVDEGVNILIDATGNLRKYRDSTRPLIKEFGEIFIDCPIEVSMKREAKRKAKFAPQGIYSKGMTGASSTVPGLNVPYEEPLKPLTVIDCTTSPEEAGKQAANVIVEMFGRSHG